MKGAWEKYELRFLFEARTSRETMRVKTTYFVTLTNGVRSGRGECALFRGLSADDVPNYESLLDYYCGYPHEALSCPYSSIRMGFETAFRSLQGGEVLFQEAADWIKGKKGIPINGLIWMGDKNLMLKRVEEKLEKGFRVLKLKIGGIDFEEELDILRLIRSRFDSGALELRLDANGAFNASNVLERLDALSTFEIHSIEQPVRAGQPELMSAVCRQSPIDVALDEELIGTPPGLAYCRQLLEKIKPAYVILKPSLCGGFSGADMWKDTARELGIGWWATSALESNVGLNAIAQWVAANNVEIPQGLGTGQLFENNVPPFMDLRGDMLFYDTGGN